MKRLVLLIVMMLGITATSYNNGRSKKEIKQPPTFIQDFNTSLDSLNTILDGKDK